MLFQGLSIASQESAPPRHRRAKALGEKRRLLPTQKNVREKCRFHRSLKGEVGGTSASYSKSKPPNLINRIRPDKSQATWYLASVFAALRRDKPLGDMMINPLLNEIEFSNGIEKIIGRKKAQKRKIRSAILEDRKCDFPNGVQQSPSSLPNLYFLRLLRLFAAINSSSHSLVPLGLPLRSGSSERLSAMQKQINFSLPQKAQKTQKSY